MRHHLTNSHAIHQHNGNATFQRSLMASKQTFKDDALVLLMLELNAGTCEGKYVLAV